jgi:uncharacterized repeat protein (TIGR01451 family)
MRRVGWHLTWAAASFTLLSAIPAAGAPALRVQFDQRGDFTWIGNTSAHDCADGVPPPVVGTVGACGAATDDTSPDVFWRAANNAAAAASVAITPARARSTAVLALPPGALVTYARLYWAAQLATNAPDTDVTLDRPGSFTSPIKADASVSVLKTGSANTFWYQSTADVTALVQTQGIGSYRVSGIDSIDLRNIDNQNPFEAWALVVFYSLATDPPRNLALFDGLDVVVNGSPAAVSLTGFLVPSTGFDAKLGVLAYEGDAKLFGDGLLFNGVALFDAQNQVDNFFNGTRSWLGSPVSIAGDLPQLTGTAGSMSGVDLDVIDVTARVTPGETTATIQATSAGDAYVLGAFVTSISTFTPDFSTTSKSFVDKNGGAIRANDVIEYTIVATNTGNDTALDTVVVDALPVGITFVPQSIRIDGVQKSDGAGDDTADYDAGTRTITARLGTGAGATAGGAMLPGDATTIKFQVTIDPTASGSIANQAIVSARGLKGNPTTAYPSDGNGNGPGSPPTSFGIDECEVSAECPPNRSICLTSLDPNACVECVADDDCGATNSGRVCEPSAHACIAGCRGSGGNGCPAGLICSSITADIGVCWDPDAGVLDGGLANDAASDGATADDGSAGSGGASGSGGANGSGGSADDGAAGSGASADDGAVDGGANPGDGAAGGSGSTSDGAAGSGGIEAGIDGSNGSDATADGATDLDGSAGAPDGSDAAPEATADARGDVLSDGGFDAASDGRGDGSQVSGGATSIATGTIEGGGCACSTPSMSSRIPGSWGALLALSGAVLARRRRRRGVALGRGELGRATPGSDP